MKIHLNVLETANDGTVKYQIKYELLGMNS